MKKTILFDTETTGLLKPSANSLDEQPYIIEIACVKIDEDFQRLDQYESFIKPPIPVSEEITRITGITQHQVNSAPTFDEVWRQLADFFVGVDTLVAHNLPFDRSMLANELLRIDRVLNFPWPPEHRCTVEMSLGIEQRRLNLAALHTHATGSKHDNAHRAMGDVYALVRCYHWLLNQ